MLHVRWYIRSRTGSRGLSRSCTIDYTIIHGRRTRATFFKSFKNHTRHTRILEWLECKSDKATVVVCTVYTGGQPCKPCVLCETGLTRKLKQGQCWSQAGDSWATMNNAATVTQLHFRKFHLFILSKQQCLYGYHSVRQILNHVTRKPGFCLQENKGTDQLCSNCTADQCHCFHFMDNTIPLLSKFEISCF